MFNLNESLSERAFADALKSVARNLQLKQYVRQSAEWYPVLLRAAERFVAGDVLERGLFCRDALDARGYRASLEYIGENTLNEAECTQAFQEFSRLIEACSKGRPGTRISLDLSHIGLSVDGDLAYRHLEGLASQAEVADLELVISMEESAKTDAILALHRKISARFANVGITLQAQLPRTLEDLEQVLTYGSGTIRIVKGAYQEQEGRYIPRSETLTSRYIQMVDLCVQAGRPVSVATHDEPILRHMTRNEVYRGAAVEIEMLYGIRTDLAKQLKDDGFPVRVYLTYGEEWFLYLCHRIAEHPPNIYDAVTRSIAGGTEPITQY
ncbi:proline dehydrogenase family protein [Paenibacillus lautus]